MIDANSQILERRWPKLAADLRNIEAIPFQLIQGVESTIVVEGIQLTSGYNRDKEARLWAAQVSEGSSDAMIYGLGLGDVAVELLRRSSLKRLVIQLLNPRLFVTVANLVDLSAVLSDERVVLSYDESRQDVYSPYAACIGDLLLASDAMAPLRDRILLDIGHHYAMRQHSNDDDEISAHFDNLTPYIRADQDAKSLLDRFRNSRTWVVAAGPTLEDSYHLLIDHRQQDEAIIAVDAAVSFLISVNIIPDIVVSIDAKADELFNVGCYEQLQDVSLVYFPRVPELLLQHWHGPRYTAYSNGQLYDHLHETLPKLRLFSAGSVLHPCVDLAVEGGASEIVLLGADFGFCKQTSHAGGNLDQDYHVDIEATGHWVLNGLGDKIQTWPNFRGYLRDLESYIGLRPQVSFINTSREGAMIQGTSQWEDAQR